MANYKEIVTKTIIGKGRKSYSSEYVLETEHNANTVLGCWIINHKFRGSNNRNEIDVNGSFDVNVWYSYDNDSKTGVTTKNLSYDESLKLRVKDMAALDRESEIIVRSLKQPTVQDVKIKDGKVILNIEKELGVEIVGESMVKIAIEEDELPWDEVVEDVKIEDVNENYLEEDTKKED